MSEFAKNMMLRRAALLPALLLAMEPVAHAQEEYAQPSYAADQGQSASPASQDVPPAQPAFSQQELDQMLAPIALYPDPLLSQILMAATYPLEVVEAARWGRVNPNLQGDEAVRAIQQRDWDPSVKSLVAFPRILQMMDEKLDWTERLGDAFLSQEAQVMETVQNLRQKAYAAGNLRSNDQVRVESQGQTIVVQPASPEVIYVPYYDPMVVYGGWWWPDYPPVFWAPWPGYFVQSGFAWGVGIIITTGFFFGDCDWRHRRVNVINVNNYYYNWRRPDARNIPRPVAPSSPGIWHHDPDHRRGIPYRTEALRIQYGRTGASPEFRHGFRDSERRLPGEQREPGEQRGLGEQREPRSSRGVESEQPRPEILLRPETRFGPMTQPRPETGIRLDAQRAHPEAGSRPEAPQVRPEAPQVRPENQRRPETQRRTETQRPHREMQPRPEAGTAMPQHERRAQPPQSMPGTVRPPAAESRPPSVSPDHSRRQDAGSVKPRVEPSPQETAPRRGGMPGQRRGDDSPGGGDDRHSK